MKLLPPFVISARLMPAVHIDGAFISLDVSGRQSSNGRDLYEAYVDLPDGSEFDITDLKSGCQGGDYREGMAALLSFLGAAAESYDYQQRTGRPGENADLFDPALVAWASEHADAISMIALEIEENPACELCGEPAGEGGAVCPACVVNHGL